MGGITDRLGENNESISESKGWEAEEGGGEKSVKKKAKMKRRGEQGGEIEG